VHVAEADNKTAFEDISLSRRTTVLCRVEEMNSDLLRQLHDPVQTFCNVGCLY